MRNRLIVVAATLVVIGAPVAAWLAGLDLPNSTLALVLGSAYLVPGALVVLKADGHRVGFLLVAIGVLFALAVAADAVDDRPLVLTFTSTAFPSVFGLFSVLCLIVPSGDLPESRLARWVVGLIPIALVSILLGPEVVSDVVVDNPIGILPGWTGPIGYLGIAVPLVYALGSLIRRFRRSDGLVHEQLRPVVAGFGLLVSSIIATLVVLFIWFPDAGGNGWVPALFSYVALPFAFMVSVLRYRLYDVGRLVRRTVGYSIVVAVLAGVYAITVLTFDGALTPLLGDGNVPVALSTLVVAVAFRPIASRVRSWVDHRFDRGAYDVDGVLEAARSGLDSAVEHDRIGAVIATVLSAALSPATMAVWIDG